MNLVDRLVNIQKENGWSDGRMAAELSVERTHWLRLRRGNRLPGTKILKGVMGRFPELKEDVSLFLSSEGSKVTDCDRIVPETTQDDHYGASAVSRRLGYWWQCIRQRFGA